MATSSPAWCADVEYSPGMLVSYNNFVYAAVVLNIGNPPSGSPFWKVVGPSEPQSAVAVFTDPVTGAKIVLSA